MEDRKDKRVKKESKDKAQKNLEADPERVTSIDEMGLHVYEMRYLPKKVRERFHREEKIKMCELFDRYVRKGRQEGMRFLILDNLEEGKTEEIIIKKLMRGYSLEQDEAKYYYDQCTMEMPLSLF